jgi:hypothetical protein
LPLYSMSWRAWRGSQPGSQNDHHRRVKRDIRKSRMLLRIYRQMAAIREFESQVNERQQETS